MAEDYNTPVKTGLKRDLPYIPKDALPSVKQLEKKIARTNTLSTPPSPPKTVMSNQTVSTSEDKNVMQWSDVVCALIDNPQFVDDIILIVLDKVLKARKPQLEEKTVSDHLQHFIETIELTKTTVLVQKTVIQQQEQTINHMTKKSTN